MTEKTMSLSARVYMTFPSGARKSWNSCCSFGPLSVFQIMTGLKADVKTSVPRELSAKSVAHLAEKIKSLDVSTMHNLPKFEFVEWKGSTLTMSLRKEMYETLSRSNEFLNSLEQFKQWLLEGATNGGSIVII